MKMSDVKPVSAGLTAALVRDARNVAYDSLSADAVRIAKHCLLDYVAVTMAGSSEEAVRIVFDQMRRQGGISEATVFGSHYRLPALSAAMVNGVAAHVLDYDDVNLTLTGHPTVAIAPALLALAETRGASGKDVIAAFAAGYDLACAIGAIMNPSHYDFGFHATATIGTIGAAAACARLLGLQPAPFANAIGIAATQAAGLKSMFGTMAKSLHVGNCNYNALLAAQLAGAGFDSCQDSLEAPQGFIKTHVPYGEPTSPMPKAPPGAHLAGNLFKYHAACYLTHATIDACRDILESNSIERGNVARVTLKLDERCERVCDIRSPATGLEAKFSLTMAAAMAICDYDTSALATYGADVVSDEAIQAMMARVDIEFQSGWPLAMTEATIKIADGAAYSQCIDAGEPLHDLDMQEKRLVAKFHALMEPLFGRVETEAVSSRLLAFDEEENVAALLRRLTPQKI